MPDKNKGGASVEGGRDVNVGGDAVGGDKVSTTFNSTTTLNAGATSNYVLFGLIGIAALAIVVLSIIALRGGNPPGSTLAAPALTFTPTLTGTHSPPSDTPSPTATATATATTTPAPPPTDTPPPGVTPTATSAVPALDFFSDNCLPKNQWILRAEQYGYATPIPTRGNCLDPRRQFFAEDDGKLSVFIDQDATRTTEQEHVFQLIPSAVCYKQVEVVAALDNVQILTDASRAYLSIGIELQRVAGDGYLEVRIEGTNTGGSFFTQTIARLTLSDGSGYQNFTWMRYNLGEVVTIAFRVKGNKLTAYVGNDPIAGPFPILSEPCVVGLGYHADPQTLLDGYFEEIRGLPAE